MFQLVRVFPLVVPVVLPVFLFAALAPARAGAGTRACLQPLEAAGGIAYFESTPAQNFERCSEALSGAWGPAGGTIDCLLQLAEVHGVALVLDRAAIDRLVTFIEASPLPPGPGSDAPILLQATELLARAAPIDALALARRLLAFGASSSRIARGLPLLGFVGEPSDLGQLALLTTTNDLALRRIAAHVAARRATPELLELVIPLLAQDDDRTADAVLEGLARHRPLDVPMLQRVLKAVPDRRHSVFATTLARSLRPTSDTELRPLHELREFSNVAAAFDAEHARWRSLDESLGPAPLAAVRTKITTPDAGCENREHLLEIDAVLRSRPPPAPPVKTRPKRRKTAK